MRSDLTPLPRQGYQLHASSSNVLQMKDGRFEIGDMIVLKTDEIYQRSVPLYAKLSLEPQRVIGVRENGDIELLARPNYWYMRDAWISESEVTY